MLGFTTLLYLLRKMLPQRHPRVVCKMIHYSNTSHEVGELHHHRHLPPREKEQTKSTASEATWLILRIWLDTQQSRFLESARGRSGWEYSFPSPERWFARRSVSFLSQGPPPVGLASFSSSLGCSRSRGRSYRSQRGSAPRSGSATDQQIILSEED